jgi:hypothetical protein
MDEALQRQRDPCGGRVLQAHCWMPAAGGEDSGGARRNRGKGLWPSPAMVFAETPVPRESDNSQSLDNCDLGTLMARTNSQVFMGMNK